MLKQLDYHTGKKELYLTIYLQYFRWNIAKYKVMCPTVNLKKNYNKYNTVSQKSENIGEIMYLL